MADIVEIKKRKPGRPPKSEQSVTQQMDNSSILRVAKKYKNKYKNDDEIYLLLSLFLPHEYTEEKIVLKDDKPETRIVSRKFNPGNIEKMIKLVSALKEAEKSKSNKDIDIDKIPTHVLEEILEKMK